MPTPLRGLFLDEEIILTVYLWLIMNFEDDNTIKLDDSEMVALGSKEQSVSIKCIALGGLLCPENRRQALLQEIADLGKRRQQRGWMCIMGLGTTFDPDFTVQHQLLGRIERVDAGSGSSTGARDRERVPDTACPLYSRTIIKSYGFRQRTACRRHIRSAAR